MWTDSTTVLQWLHSFDKKPEFVANRIAEFPELATVDEWNHVPTVDIPAEAGKHALLAEAFQTVPSSKVPSF